MLFDSFDFIIFLAVVVSAYFAIPHGMRRHFLLLSGCVFYASFSPRYLLVLGAIALVGYLSAIWIEGAPPGGSRRKALLAASVSAMLAVLFIFKYYGFFAENAGALARLLGWNYSLKALALAALPIGLSFQTLQGIAYVAEVYKGSWKAERDPVTYSLFVSFFPTVVAGPIERPQHLLPQLKEEHKFDYPRVSSGLRTFAWGLFMKMVIADRLAAPVSILYSNFSELGGPVLLFATLMFSFQIFCDFAGYSAMAVGMARILGFELVDNFKSPYLSGSFAEFWRRWHISLSSWFRDYVYIPLGGNRVSRARMIFNVMAVFVLSGLWHGASWTFVVWGAFHGALVAASPAWDSLWSRFSGGLAKALKIASTFFGVSIGWVFFKASTLPQAFRILASIFTDFSLRHNWPSLGMDRTGFYVPLAAALLVALVQIFGGDWKGADGAISRWPKAARWALYAAAAASILLFGVFENIPFVYLQF